MTNYAQVERRALAELFEEVGPDHPTRCGDWRTGDLAAHLVIRERRPDAALGIAVPLLAGYGDRVVRSTRDATPWPRLIDQVRSGPPLLLRPLDSAINTVEYFVHHEDVRRADGAWTARDLDPAEESVLWSRLALLGRVLFRAAPGGVDLDAPGFGHRRARGGGHPVTVIGRPSELVLFAYGRQDRSDVRLEGSEADTGALRQASLGL